MTILGKISVLTGLTLSLYTGVRLLLFIRNRRIFGKKPWGAICLAFLRGIRFDASIILTVFALPIALLLLPLPGLPLINGGGGPWAIILFGIMFLLCCAMLLILIADLFYFDDVHRHIGSELLLLGNDWGQVRRMICEGYLVQFAGLILAVCGLALFWFWIASLPTNPVAHPFAAFLLVGFLVFLGIRSTRRGKSLNIIDAFRCGDTELGNLTLNGTFSAYHSSRASKRRQHHFMEDKEALQATFEALGGLSGQAGHDPKYPLLRSYTDNRPNGYNLVFILLESWGTKYVDSFGGNGYGATPNFDRIAAQGVRFPHFHAVGQRSINAIQAILSGTPIIPGLPQIGKGLESSNVLQLGHTALRHGYRTVFVKSAKRRSFRVDSIAQAAGFQEYYGYEDMRLLLDYKDPEASHFGWDYETFMHLKSKIDESTGPFLGFTFSGTTHIPYANPGSRFLIRPHSISNENGFLNTLAYSDWSLGEFFKAAESSPWFDRTIFVMTADTTLGLFQSGDVEDRFRIPLVLYAPKILKPQVVDTIGSQLDLLPTLYDLLGFEDQFAAIGDSLFRKQRQLALIEQGEILGLVGRSGYLRHSLQNRLESVSTDPAFTGADFDELERLLLALDQTTYRLLKENRWVPSF